MQQLDLFLDSCDVVLSNDVVATLAAGDREAARHALARLRQEAPEHCDLPAFGELLAFLDHFSQHLRPLDGSPLATETTQQLNHLLTTRITRCATVLGSKASLFLDPLWQQLAAAASERFDPARPELHPAALLLRCRNYGAAERAAAAIDGHDANAAVLRWRALARYRRSGGKGIRLPIFLLAWCAPETLADVLAELGDERLDRAWREFQQRTESLDASWFPAWHLLRYPETASDDRTADASNEETGGRSTAGSYRAALNAPAAQAWLLLTEIIALERQGYSRKLIERRARLQAINAEFYASYMQSRTSTRR